MKFTNVKHEEFVRLAALAGAVGIQTTYGRVTGTLSIAGQETSVDGTYPEVNDALRQLTVQGDGEVEFHLFGQDEYGNEFDLKQVVTMPAAVVEREVTPVELDDDGNQIGGEVVSERTIYATASCPLVLADVYLDIEVPEEGYTRAIKQEAANRIEDLFPIWKQSNAQQRMIELLEKGKSNWTADEKKEVSAIRQGMSAIKRLRAASDKLEQVTDKTLDIWSDAHWVE